MLLSTVRSRSLKDITTMEGEKKRADFGWIRANLGFITDRHQICVGITRCKYGLVIVGELRSEAWHVPRYIIIDIILLFLAGNQVLLSYAHTWNRLIEHYKKKRCIRNGGEFPESVRDAMSV